MACFTYSRVSTARRSDEGESLDVQARVLARYAQMLGLTIDRAFVERGISGNVPLDQRPAGQAMLAALQPGDVMITTRLDRMFRSAIDALRMLATFKDGGISLHMLDLGGDVTGNGVSKLVFTILSAVSEAERDRIRERIADVKHDQRARGRYLGGLVPFGWRVGDDGAMVEVPAQQRALTRMKKLRAEGLSFRAIEAELAKAGHHITHQGIRQILKRQNQRAAPVASPKKGPP
jgi:DNA invertase Pin-like site-specific DNA recombinase